MDSILYKISKVVGDIPTHVIYKGNSGDGKKYDVYKDDDVICRAVVKGNVMKIFKGRRYIGKELLSKEELLKI